MVPQIAADLLVDVKTAALLSTAFTLPYALMQPVLGTIADFFGKTRLMNMSLLVVSLTALVCAVATSFELVFAMRVAAGLVAGGVFPVAMALIGDLVPIQQRQVMIGRLLAVGLTGNVLGAAIAGIIGDLFGWRGIFAVIGLFGLIITVAAFYILRSFPVPKPRPAFNLAGRQGELPHRSSPTRAPSSASARCSSKASSSTASFRMSRSCCSTSGEARASIAGIVIAAFGLGGVIYSLSVPALVAHFAERRLMLIGGALAATALTLAALHFPWDAQVAIFGMFGFGFYLLHGCIQVHVTDLSPTARGAAASLHSSFFFIGQAAGPVIYGFGYSHGSLEPLMFLGSAVIIVVAIVCSRFLRHRRPRPVRHRHRRLDSAVAEPHQALVKPHQNAHYQGDTAWGAASSRLRSHPRTCLGNASEGSSLLTSGSARFGKAPKVAIIGAGVIGLGIAWRLAAQGRDRRRVRSRRGGQRREPCRRRHAGRLLRSRARRGRAGRARTRQPGALAGVRGRVAAGVRHRRRIAHGGHAGGRAHRRRSGAHPSSSGAPEEARPAARMDFRRRDAPARAASRRQARGRGVVARKIIRSTTASSRPDCASRRKRAGATIHEHTPVKEISIVGGRADGVVLADGVKVAGRCGRAGGRRVVARHRAASRPSIGRRCGRSRARCSRSRWIRRRR